MPPKARSERSKSQSKNASKTAKANATKGEGNAGSTRRTTRQQRLASASASQSDSGATSADEEDEDVSEMNDEEDEEMSTPVAADKTKWRSSKVNGEMQSDADASSPLYSAFNKPRAKSGIKYGSSSSSGGGKNQVQAHANLGATSGSAKSPNRATKSSSSATERMFGNVVSGNVNREEVKQGAEQEQARARAQSRPGGKQAKHATKQQQQQQQQQERDELQDEEVDGKQRKKREKAAGGAKKSKKATSTARTKMDKEVTSAHSEDADVVDMVVETQAGVVPENAIAGFLDNYDLESSRQMSTLQASLSHSLSLATQQMSLYITRLPSVVRRMTLGEFVREYEADAKLVMSRAGKGRLTEGRGASVRGVVGVESEDWDKLAEKTKGRGKRRGEEEDDDHEKSKNARLADKSRVKTSRLNASTARRAKGADDVPSTSRTGEASGEEKERPPSSSFNPAIPSPAKKLSLGARAHDSSSTIDSLRRAGAPARSSGANGAPPASRTAQEGEMVKFYTSDGQAVTGVVVGGVLQPLTQDARDAEMGGGGGRISNATGAVYRRNPLLQSSSSSSADEQQASKRGDALEYQVEDDVRAEAQDESTTMADQSDSLALPDEDKLMRQYVAQHEKAQRRLGAQLLLPSSSNSNPPAAASSGSVSDDGSSANTKTRQESSFAGPPIAGGRGRSKESQTASRSRPAHSSSSSCAAPSSSRPDLAAAAAAATSTSKGARLSMQLANGTTKDVSTLTKDDVHALHPDVLEQLRRLLGDASVAR